MAITARHAAAVFTTQPVTAVLDGARAAIRSGSIAVLKNALVLGTAISWFFGIVVYNGDVTFTLFNVVGHGVPYMALVWAFGRKKRSASDAKGVVLRTFFSLRAVPLYLVLLFVLAYAEEGLWNSMVWKEHLGIFAPFAALPAVHAHTMLSFLVPLLSLPQVTHYIIDAFIWRLRKDRDGWQQVIFGRTSVLEATVAALFFHAVLITNGL